MVWVERLSARARRWARGPADRALIHDIGHCEEYRANNGAGCGWRVVDGEQNRSGLERALNVPCVLYPPLVSC